MANPLPKEKEIYERLKKENIIIHPLIWELINHHIRNELHMINLIIGSTVLDGEILSEGDAGKVLKHSKAIQEFLDELWKVTEKK